MAGQARSKYSKMENLGGVHLPLVTVFVINTEVRCIYYPHILMSLKCKRSLADCRDARGTKLMSRRSSHEPDSRMRRGQREPEGSCGELRIVDKKQLESALTISQRLWRLADFSSLFPFCNHYFLHLPSTSIVNRLHHQRHHERTQIRTTTDPRLRNQTPQCWNLKSNLLFPLSVVFAKYSSLSSAVMASHLRAFCLLRNM